MTVSLEEATNILTKLNAKVQQGDVDGGNDVLAEMKVSFLITHCYCYCCFLNALAFSKQLSSPFTVPSIILPNHKNLDPNARLPINQ